jgi:hypothetical protein
LLVLCLVFPPRTFKEKFTGQGVVLLALLSAGAILLQGRLELIPKLGLQALLAYILLGMAAVAIAILLLSWLMERAPSLPRLLSGLADRMTVFSFIYIPLSLAGWVVVILRNLF